MFNDLLASVCSMIEKKESRYSWIHRRGMNNARGMFGYAGAAFRLTKGRKGNHTQLNFALYTPHLDVATLQASNISQPTNQSDTTGGQPAQSVFITGSLGSPHQHPALAPLTAVLAVRGRSEAEPHIAASGARSASGGMHLTRSSFRLRYPVAGLPCSDETGTSWKKKRYLGLV